ncbi:MAG: HEAT repeat domain-containing protein [Gemmatimonadetes bacterium]|nr:HEAT repeat domain-containing protein [Gemmatimonadota bacterium]
MRVRQAAVKALAVFPGSSFVADALLRAAEDASPEVRLAATVVLQGRREPRLASALVQRVDAEPELDVQLAIIAALGRMAVPEGVQKLVALAMPDQRLLRRRDISTLRLSAIEAMGEARTPQAMVALQKLLEDRDKDVRETAARLYTRARRQTSAGSMPVVSEP